MVNRFTVNGVTYTAKPFDFDMLCELEGVGVDVSNIGNMNMSLIRGYFAVCANMSKEEAAGEIQKHIINGGTFTDIAEPMSKEMESSGFFRALANRNEEGENENPSESATESESEKTKRGRKPRE